LIFRNAWDRIPGPYFPTVARLIPCPTEGGVKALDLPFVCSLGASLDAVAGLEGGDSMIPFATYRLIKDAQGHVETLLGSFEVTVCSEEGRKFSGLVQELDTKIGEWLATDDAEEQKKAGIVKDLNRRLDVIASDAREFRTVLLAELNTLRAYLVTQKGIYSTADLVEHAEKTLPLSVIEKIPKGAVGEMQESGKCLAFECSTAAGFHVLRATELVLHCYYLACCTPSSPDTLPNWGAYIAELRQCGTPAINEVASLIQQIKDLNRNLIMHPEVALSTDEAFTLFELCKSAIILMAAALPSPASPPAVAVTP
jgi:hypothetical protein